MTRSIGNILLALYLIIVGITAITPAMVIPSIVIGVIALLAGICILLGK